MMPMKVVKYKLLILDFTPETSILQHQSMVQARWRHLVVKEADLFNFFSVAKKNIFGNDPNCPIFLRLFCNIGNYYLCIPDAQVKQIQQNE